MKVKICGLTNAADAAFAVAEGADLLGFVVHPSSPRHCANLVEASNEVRESAVLVMVADDAETFIRTASAAGIRSIQPHVSPEYRNAVVQRLKSEGYFILLPWMDVQAQEAIPADLYVWESNSKETGMAGGSGQTHAMNFPPPGPFLLAGGLAADNLSARLEIIPAKARTHLRGFDAASHLERSPGIKDPLKVRAFIQRARSMTAEA